MNVSANADVRDVDLLLDWVDPLEEGMATQSSLDSCLENPMDRGAWQATVHRVAKSWTWLKWLSMRKENKNLCFQF